MDVLIAAAVFLAALIVCLVCGADLFWALALTFLALVLCGLRRGKTLRELRTMVRRELPGVFIVIRILCYVGLLTGLWRSSGTIAFFIWYGMRIIPPQLFLLLAFVLSALLSYAIGTSFGVTSTAGVMLIALARAGGVPVPIAAGVILSGVYFGDRGAPTSSCAAMNAAITKTDHYGNVRRMLKTAALPILLTLIVYTVLSLRNPITRVDTALLTALEERFTISWPLILPALIMLLLPLLKLPIRLCMGISALSAFALSVFVQRMGLLDALRAAILGYAPGGVLESVLSGGGLLSMVSTMLLLLFAAGCTGIIDGLRLLSPAQDALARLSRRIGRFPAICVASLLSAMIFCNQTIALVFCRELMESTYLAQGTTREELAEDIACSVVTLSGLVPWCIACSVPLTMLGAPFAAIPYACFLYLVPLCYFFTKRFFFPKPKTDEVTAV